MTSGDPRAEAVFLNDVEETYQHLHKRAREIKSERENEEHEQIQLVPENPEHTISFNIPDGPPPADLRIAEGAEGTVNIEEARKYLQMQWEVFEGFDPELKEALKSQSLEKVNKVIGSMKVEKAEQIVGLLDSAGILNFVEGGVRDETNQDTAKGSTEVEEGAVEGEKNVA